MYRNVSDAWITAHKEFLSPEGFVELSCYVPELGETLVWTKNDLIRYTHQQTGDLVSGELPKNHIEFSLDNSSGIWNPSSPISMEQYLAERLKIVVRYGFDINGKTEWIPGGVFYLSEWRTSYNGFDASFVARDLLEYMLNKTYTGEVTGTLYELAERAIAEADIPADAVVSLSDELKKYTVGAIEYDGKDSVAEILQKCANAAGCVMYQDRDGVFTIGKAGYEDTGYVIPMNLSYSYPEVELSRPMKDVQITYQGNAEYLYHNSDTGETQTLTNEFIRTEEQAEVIAEWVCRSLRVRRQITGEFRGDPRLDLFDSVRVESKYGTITGVVLTDIKYSFTGAFHVSYSGYIHGTAEAAVIYAGEKYAGEVK